MARTRLLFLCLLVLMLPVAVRAQEATPEPVPVAVQVEPVNQVPVFELVERAERAADDAARYAGDASNFLSIFEAISVVLTVAVGAVGVFGVTRLFSAQNELTKARQEVKEELKALRESFEREVLEQEADLEALRTQLLGTLEEQRSQTQRSMLAQALLPLGERQYKAQDLYGAADTYKRALVLDGMNPLVHYRLGYVYVQSGELNDAEEHLQRALEIDPEFVLARAALGYVYRRMGDKLEPGMERDRLHNKGETLLLEALAANPKLVDDDSEAWWGSLGGLYRRRGQLDQAIRAYEQAALVTPHSSYPFSNLALLYMQREDRDKMLQTYKRVERLARGEVQAEVDNYWAYADLLTARLALGRVEDAEDALISVFDIAPHDSPYTLEMLVDTLNRLTHALGGDTEAPHVRPFIERIRAFIASRHGEDGNKGS